MRHNNFFVSEISKGFNYQKISKVKGTISMCSFSTVRSLLPFTFPPLYYVTYRGLTSGYPLPTERGVSAESMEFTL